MVSGDMDRLSFYDELFCQYVGLYGFSSLEAYCKARNILPEQVDQKVRDRAKAALRRKIIKDKISEYADSVKTKAIAIAQDSVAYGKADAMKDVQFLMQKCRQQLEISQFDQGDIQVVIDVLEEHFTKITPQGKDYIEKGDAIFIGKVADCLAKPKLDSKTGELFAKTIRLAGELYDLLNTDVKLSVDDDAKKLIGLLESLSLDALVNALHGGISVSPKIIG